MADSSIYVTDTHSLLWHLTDSPKLSVSARRAFQQVERGEADLIVPVIVLAELIYLAQKGRFSIDLETLLERLDQNSALEIVPLSEQVTKEIRTITSVSEMHDRLIVCEAKLRNAKLITRDQEIQKARIVETIW